ncbi:MAG: VCBS repeat-containing protein [Rhizobium sp.]|nr:VCBS repeat-containing protein [Rhizobium sp.]
MAKYFKAVWSGNIISDILKDFGKDVEKKLDIKHSNTSQWQSEYGDFNGDGKDDILLSYWGANYDGEPAKKSSDGQLILLLGNGAKGFKDGTDLLPNNGRLNSMTMNSAIGDFNNDGTDDIVLTNHSEDGRNNPTDFLVDQYAYFSSAGGDFDKINLNFNTWARQSFADDFNNDGRLDFAVFGWQPNEDGNHLSFYHMNEDGSYTQSFAEGWLGGNVIESGDFDGDGEVEIFTFSGRFVGDGKGYILNLYELADDGSVQSPTTTVEEFHRMGKGESWGGHITYFPINKFKNGDEYYDDGIHFGDVGDINGDGADDVVAINYAYDFKTEKGIITPTKNITFLQFYSAAGGDGLEAMDVKVRGWTPPKFLLNDLHLVDWNGDGHLDIFIPSEDPAKGGVRQAERVYLNDGTGNFDRLNQKFLPSGDNPNNNEFGDYVDANGDGIMDVIVRPKGFDGSWQKWDKFSETLYLGTKRIASSDSVHNAAQDGAAGFNEDYYLNHIDGTEKMMRGAGFGSALEHFLAVGKESGAFGFAAGTHVYGYSGSETITLREGNETVDAFGGDDILTGAGGADTLNGGKGADTFVYLAVTDSGVTATTRDVIEDFVSGTDRIDLSGIDAIAGTVSNDAFNFLEAEGAAFTGQAGELRLYSTGSGAAAGRILEGDVDGDAVADFQIELLGTGTINLADISL